MSSTRKVNLFSTNIPRCWYVRTRPDQNKDSSQPKFKWWGRGGGVLKLAVKNPLWSGGVEDHIFCCRANFGAEHSVALIEGGLKPHVFAAQLRERQAGLRVFFFVRSGVTMVQVQRVSLQHAGNSSDFGGVLYPDAGAVENRCVLLGYLRSESRSSVQSGGCHCLVGPMQQRQRSGRRRLLFYIQTATTIHWTIAVLLCSTFCSWRGSADAPRRRESLIGGQRRERKGFTRSFASGWCVVDSFDSRSI